MNEDNKCVHWECPYKFCPFHEFYDDELENCISAFSVPIGSVDECTAYMDI